jgi:hypothetical protein
MKLELFADGAVLEQINNVTNLNGVRRSRAHNELASAQIENT